MSGTLVILLSNGEIRAKACVSEATYNHNRFLDKIISAPIPPNTRLKSYILCSPRPQKIPEGQEFFGGAPSLFNVSTAWIGLRKLERAFPSTGQP
jgi:hypothetical protein